MSSLWLASYILLWILVLGLYLLAIGLLQQIGLLHRQLTQSGLGIQVNPEPSVPTVEDDGPSIGTNFPHQALETFNGYGTLLIRDLQDRGEMLFIVLSPMCETCQDVVELLNSLVRDGPFHGSVVVLMKSDEQACRAFLNIFPLHLPVVCDSTRNLIRSLNVHNIPFGLLYDTHGILKRKGVVGNRDKLFNLLKDNFVSLSE